MAITLGASLLNWQTSENLSLASAEVGQIAIVSVAQINFTPTVTSSGWTTLAAYSVYLVVAKILTSGDISGGMNFNPGCWVAGATYSGPPGISIGNTNSSTSSSVINNTKTGSDWMVAATFGYTASGNAINLIPPTGFTGREGDGINTLSDTNGGVGSIGYETYSIPWPASSPNDTPSWFVLVDITEPASGFFAFF